MPITATEMKVAVENLEKLNVNVKAVRDELENVKTEDGLSKEKIAKLETDIKKFMEEQTKFNAKFAMMPIKGEDGVERTAEEAQRIKAFSEWCKKGYSEMPVDLRKALVENTEGGYLIPQELERNIIMDLPEITIMRNLATVISIKTNKLSRRSMTDFTVGWGALETGSDLTESDTTISTHDQHIEDCLALTKVGKNELMDAFANLERVITKNFSMVFSEEEDKQFMVGTGHTYKKPEGIFDSGSGISTKRAASSTALGMDDVLNLIYELPAKYRGKGSAFLMNSATELAIMKLRAGGSTTTDGSYLWQPSMILGRPNTLKGYPVYNQDDIPSTLEADALVVAFGAWKWAYRIIDRTGLTVQRLSEKYAEQGQVGFLFKKRLTGGVIRTDAARILQMKASG